MCVEFQLLLLMMPIVYYLNKSYVDNLRTSSNHHNNANTDNKTGKHQDKQNEVNINSHYVDRTDRFFAWIRTIPGLILVACIVIGLGSSFYNVYTRELPPSFFYTMADPESKGLYFDQHLMRPWTHLAVFALGIIAGLECRRIARRISLNNQDNQLNQHAYDRPSYKRGNLEMILDRHGADRLRNHKINMFSSSMPAISPDSIFNSSNGLLNGSSKTSNSNNISSTDSSVSVNLNGSYDSINTQSQYLNDDSRSNNHLNGSNTSINNRRLISPVIVNTIGFIVAISTMATIIFSTHEWSMYDLPEPIVAGLFDAGSRFLWSLALIWILYMVSVPSEKGKFSVLARSLGHPAMVCLGKLSFLIYIIHPFVHTAVLAIQEQPIYSSWLMLFHILIGNITITVILASLVSLFVEMPCRNLFRRCGTSILLAQTAATATTMTPATSATISNDSRPSGIGFVGKRGADAPILFMTGD